MKQRKKELQYKCPECGVEFTIKFNPLKYPLTHCPFCRKILNNWRLKFMIFGQYLKEAREKTGISQKKLAEEIGFNYTYLNKIENGQVAPPKEETIKKICEVLNTDFYTMMFIAGRVPEEFNAKILKYRELFDMLKDYRK